MPINHPQRGFPPNEVGATSIMASKNHDYLSCCGMGILLWNWHLASDRNGHLWNGHLGGTGILPVTISRRAVPTRREEAENQGKPCGGALRGYWLRS
ncbi:MAG: hypothetical protein F6K56_20430 [Moorea sp. SIO3G5]|nr:hypothetical protein [Moorena sp. SIO3G5]